MSSPDCGLELVIPNYTMAFVFTRAMQLNTDKHANINKIHRFETLTHKLSLSLCRTLALDTPEIMLMFTWLEYFHVTSLINFPINKMSMGGKKTYIRCKHVRSNIMTGNARLNVQNDNLSTKNWISTHIR